MAGAPTTIPTLRLPALVQTLVGLVWPEEWIAFLLRRYEEQRCVRAKLVGLGELVAVSDPETLKALFTADRDAVRAGEANAKVLGAALGTSSLLTLDGERHLRMRRLLLPSFTGEVVRGYAPLVEQIASDEVARWRTGEEVELSERMQAITLEVILRLVMGVRDRRRLDRLRRLVPKVLQVNPFVMVMEARHPRLASARAARLLPWIRARHAVDALIYEEIAEHRREPEGRDDVLARLIAARGEDDARLTDAELRDQLMTLLLAGHETTASSLAWCFERLVRHPEAYARLRDEVRGGADGGPYLDAVINETLRTRPVLEAAWRQVQEPVVVAGHRLEPGTLIGIGIRGAHRGEAYPEPRAFRPERFLEQAPGTYTLVAFGGGPRRCLGASFALMEMRTIVRVVLARVDLHAVRAKDERESRARFTSTPSRGARVRVTRI